MKEVTLKRTESFFLLKSVITAKLYGKLVVSLSNQIHLVIHMIDFQVLPGLLEIRIYKQTKREPASWQPINSANCLFWGNWRDCLLTKCSLVRNHLIDCNNILNAFLVNDQNSQSLNTHLIPVNVWDTSKRKAWVLFADELGRVEMLYLRWQGHFKPLRSSLRYFKSHAYK